MRTELQTLPATGLQLPAVGKSPENNLWFAVTDRVVILPLVDKINSTDVKGFPIVTPDDQRTLLGYIGRTELNYVLRRHPLFTLDDIISDLIVQKRRSGDGMCIQIPIAHSFQILRPQPQWRMALFPI